MGAEHKCYWCFMDLRVADKLTSCGIGRIMKPLQIEPGMCKLFFISCMRLQFRNAVKKQLGSEEESEKNEDPQKSAGQMLSSSSQLSV